MWHFITSILNGSTFHWVSLNTSTRCIVFSLSLSLLPITTKCPASHAAEDRRHNQITFSISKKCTRHIPDLYCHFYRRNKIVNKKICWAIKTAEHSLKQMKIYKKKEPTKVQSTQRPQTKNRQSILLIPISYLTYSFYIIRKKKLICSHFHWSTNVFCSDSDNIEKMIGVWGHELIWVSINNNEKW